MNLTVAMKIIGGFAVITLLLLTTSISSFMNLGTISDATDKVSSLAIPMLKGSNTLDVLASDMGKQLLQAYYQTDLAQLEKVKKQYQARNQEFDQSFKKLKQVVQQEAGLSSNLRKIDKTYAEFEQHVEKLFSNRKNNIETITALNEKSSQIEEQADEAATLLLDLADHDLAETKLQRAVSMGEAIESQFNSLVSSVLEFRDIKDRESVDLIGKDIKNTVNDLNQKINDVISELNSKKVTDVAQDLEQKFNDIKTLIESGNGILALKQTQLQTFDTATKELELANASIKQVNKILADQVVLADKTTADISKQVSSAVGNGNTNTTIILIVSVIASIGIAYYTLISITRPLARINEMLNIVAAGDLSRKLDDKGSDEFAELAKNCNKVIENLRALIQGIINRSTQLAAAAEQTSAVTAQSTSAIQEQRKQVEQAATATTEMSSTAQSMMASVNDALGEIKHADEEAEHVKTIGAQNKETIERLANEVDSAAQVINQLEQDSASIGGILDVIRGIAEQTNLLALNAAIEAARAGEQGRGFAVVADEVRTLASRTQESTQEIQNMIEVLQNGAQKAVTVMNNGKNQASDCVDLADTAAQALETITEAVHQAFDRSTQVSTAANEQSVVAHEISENLESIVAIAEQTSAGAQQTADSSSEVARLAEELQQSVQEFKV